MEQVWSTLDLSSTLPGTGSVGNSVADGSASACPAHDLIEIMISSSFAPKFFFLLLLPSLCREQVLMRMNPSYNQLTITRTMSVLDWFGTASGECLHVSLSDRQKETPTAVAREGDLVLPRSHQQTVSCTLTRQIYTLHPHPSTLHVS